MVAQYRVLAVTGCNLPRITFMAPIFSRLPLQGSTVHPGSKLSIIISIGKELPVREGFPT